MLKNSCLILIMLVFTASGFSYAQTPAEFNKNLSARADSFFRLGAIWGNKLEDITNGSKRYDELKPYRLKAIEYLDAQVSELGTLRDVKDSKALRMALIDFLKFEKGLINSAFMQIEKLAPYSTSKEVEDAFAHLEQESQKEEPYLMKLTQAQDTYAKNNGFKVEHEEGKKMD